MQVKKLKIYENICDSALEEFCAKGYDKTTMRNVAKNAGVALGNIYRYFPSKASLFDDLIEDTYDGFLAFLEDYRKIFISTDPERRGTQSGDIIGNYFTFDRRKIYILLHRSQGTKFEEFERKSRDLLVDISTDLAEVVKNNENIVIVDHEIHHFIAETMVSSIKSMTSIFEDEKVVRDYLEKLLDGQLVHMIRKLGYKS